MLKHSRELQKIFPKLEFETNNSYVQLKDNRSFYGYSYNYNSSIIAGINDWNASSLEEVVKVISRLSGYPMPDISEFTKEGKNKMVFTKIEGQKAGEEMGELLVSFLRTDVPFMTYYKLAQKFALIEGYSNEAAFSYVEGFVGVFSQYFQANTQNKTIETTSQTISERY